MEGEGVEKCGWIMMGVVSIGIGAILEYDRASSVVRRAVTAVQASPAIPEVDEAASAMADRPNDSFHLTEPDLHSYLVPHPFIFALVGSLASTGTSSRIAVM
jgi:hypothetical protein